jgi:hypothetical protein
MIDSFILSKEVKRRANLPRESRAAHPSATALRLSNLLLLDQWNKALHFVTETDGRTSIALIRNCKRAFLGF